MLGYLALCAMLAGLGFLAFLRMAEISDSFAAHTRNLAREMRLSNEIASKAMVARLSANSYVNTHSQVSLNHFNNHISELKEVVDQTRHFVTEPDRRDFAAQLAELVDAYDEGFREVVALIQARQNREYRDLNAIKFRMKTLLSSIRATVPTSESVPVFLLLGNVQEAFLHMIMHSSQYLRNGDDRDGVLFDNAQIQALEALDGLERAIADSIQAQHIALARESVRNFKTVMDDLIKNYQRQRQVLKTNLRDLEKNITDVSARTVLEITGHVSDHKQAATQSLARVRFEILGALTLVLLTAMGLSLVISRGIAAALNKVMRASQQIADNDLRKLSERFKLLSSGDLQADLEITAEPLRIQRSDEVGRMARAFDDMIYRLKESEQSFAAMIAYLRDKVRTAEAVACGSLDVSVPVASQNDALGAALLGMVDHLRMSRDAVLNQQERLAELVSQRTQELEESRRFLSNLLSNLPGMAYRCKDDPAWAMEFVSQGCVELTGYQPEDFIHNRKLSFNDVIHPEYRSVLKDEWQKVLITNDRPFQQEYPLITATGEMKWVFEQGIGVFDERGVVQALEGFIIDVSARKRLEAGRLEMERQLLHTQKLESLGVLAGGIAHDFNNLLAAMLGNLELALLDTPRDASSRKRLEQAEKAARQAAGLTRQMLAYSGKGHFLVNDVNLSQLVEENAEIFRTSIAKTITLSLQLAPSIPLIKADTGQIQQVVMNLITNASESMELCPGMMTLSTGLMKCDATYLNRSRIEDKPDPGWFAWLEVTDVGSGMDEQAKQRLFDPFFTTKFTGRGLGLAAVLGIIRGHNGAIMVDSEPGLGTTVRVLFPVSEDVVVMNPEPLDFARKFNELDVFRDAADAQNAHLPGLILVVDDEAMVRETCVEALQHMGYHVLEAVDGLDALRIFKEKARNIVCVILDLMMPNLDGFGTFTELQRIKPGVPVVLCSGYAAKEATSRFQDRQPSGFLQKPYNLEQLRRELEQALAEDFQPHPGSP